LKITSKLFLFVRLFTTKVPTYPLSKHSCLVMSQCYCALSIVFTLVEKQRSWEFISFRKTGLKFISTWLSTRKQHPDQHVIPNLGHAAGRVEKNQCRPSTGQQTADDTDASEFRCKTEYCSPAVNKNTARKIARRRSTAREPSPYIRRQMESSGLFLSAIIRLKTARRRRDFIGRSDDTATTIEVR
jgi:hypothetical protein